LKHLKNTKSALELPGKEGFSVLDDHMQQFHNQEQTTGQFSFLICSVTANIRNYDVEKNKLGSNCCPYLNILKGFSTQFVSDGIPKQYIILNASLFYNKIY